MSARPPAAAAASKVQPNSNPNPNPNPNRRQTGGIQVSSRYLASSSSASSSSSSATATANPRKRPAPEPKPALSAATDHAPSKRAKKSAAAPAPKTPRKKSLAPAPSSTAVTPRRRATVGPTGSAAADRELLQLAASLRTRPGATAAAADSSCRRDTAASTAPRSARKSTAAGPNSAAAAAPPPASRKSMAGPTSRKSSKPSAASSAPLPTPTLAPIPLDPSWTQANTHTLHRLVQWTYLAASTAAAHAADHDQLRAHLARAADLIDMRVRLLGAVRDRVACEQLAPGVEDVRKESQRVRDVVDRIEQGGGGEFCSAHARVVRAVQAGVDVVNLQGGARVGDVDVFVEQVRVAGEALERVVGALDGEALQEASKQVDVLLANTARLVEVEERERRLTAEAHGIELRAQSLAVDVPQPVATCVGQSVMASLGL